jgi:hypothetical protein
MQKTLWYYTLTYTCFKSEIVVFYTTYSTYDLPPNVNIGQWKRGIAERVECDCIDTT